MCKFDLKNGDTRIDPCMRSLVHFLKSEGFPVISCCCGHQKKMNYKGKNISIPMTIVVSSVPYSEGPCEVLSGVSIPRKKRFYKRNKQGVYYIPEVMENARIHK